MPGKMRGASKEISGPQFSTGSELINFNFDLLRDLIDEKLKKNFRKVNFMSTVEVE